MAELTPVDRSTIRAKQWLYFTRYGTWFLGGGVALVFTNLLGLEIPTQVGNAVQQISEMSAEGASLSDLASPRYAATITAGKWIIALAIGASLARIVSRILIFNAGRFIEYDIRNELYDKLTRLDAAFYQHLPTGDITSRITNDVSYIRLLYAIAFLHIINTALAYIISIQKMGAIDWKLTIASLLPFPFLVFGLRFVVNAIFTQTKLVQSQLATLSNKVQENLAGITVVKTFNLEELEVQSFSKSSKTYYGHGIKLALIRGTMGILTTFIAGCATLIVIWQGSQRVIEGTMELGQFIEFNSYVVALAFPTTALGWVFSVWHRGLAAFERTEEIAQRPAMLSVPEHPSTLPPHDPNDGCGEIIFEHVNFRYNPEDDDILHDVSLTIAAGSRVAIVGKTGSGKSTLLKLLSRMYDPQSGSVSVDGLDIRELEPRALRREIGYVAQDPFLFSMTIEQNLRFGLDAVDGDPTLSARHHTHSLLHPGRASTGVDELISEALEIAGLTQDIEGFPDGLETMVGERGITLSGGQKQRVTIARALLTNPRIMVLDDALSSVDTHTESKILGHLDALMDGRTSILVTHRFNALASMDTILVLDEGRIVEQGTHNELLEREGHYAQIVAQQQLRESIERDDTHDEEVPS